MQKEISIPFEQRQRIKVDFHCHTLFSSDSLTPIHKIVTRAKECDIDKIVITDHNTIKGAQLAQAAYPDVFIIGEEIKTTQGELLAIFVQEEIPRDLSPQETIQRLRQQDAFISVSHPFDIRRSGWALEEFQKIAPQVDAIEIFNARCFNHRHNHQAAAFAQQHQMAGTVGSDAHTLVEVGRTALELPYFSTTTELRQAIKYSIPIPHYTSPWILLYSVYTRVYKKFAKSRVTP